MDKRRDDVENIERTYTSLHAQAIVFQVTVHRGIVLES